MRLSEPFFEECFALKDLYVPPQGIAKATFSDSLEASIHEAVDLTQWLEGQLQDRDSFAVIEAPPGYGNIAQTYFDFLKRGGMFRRDLDQVELKAMVHQPLMLYLLGILHRDGLLDEGILQMPYPQVKFEIYDRLVTWLLGEPTAGLSTPIHRTAVIQAGLSHAGRSREAITNLLQDTPPEELRHQMQVAALQSGHSGRAWAAKTGPLPAFYFRSVSVNWPMGSSLEGLRVEFSHPNLGEYLCAEQIAAKLKSLTSTTRDAYGELTFEISSAAVFAQQIYDLLGYGLLSIEIEELVAERLWREEARDRGKFRFRTLFTRLHSFYRSYCRGRWMDEGMAHSARDRFGELGNPFNALQIDAAVGLNVFVLLCACGREAQIPFSPCGNSISSDKPTIGQLKVSNADVAMDFNPS